MRLFDGEAYRGSESQEPLLPWEIFVRNAPRLIHDARKIAEAANSWRKFNVGTAALVFDFYGNPDILYAANNSPYPGSDKDCGEMGVMDIAQGLGYKIYAFVVAGPPQIDQVSKQESPTLHSCHACRQKFADNMHSDSAIVDGLTINMSVHPKEDILEIYSVAELLEIHRQAMRGRRVPTTAIAFWSQNGNLTAALRDFGAEHPTIASRQFRPLEHSAETRPIFEP